LLTAHYLMNPRFRQLELGETSAVHYFATVIGWDQRWPMFAPRPAPSNPWWSVEGLTPTGQRVDLWSVGGQPGVKPADWEATYRSVEWMDYMYQVWAGKPHFHEALANYFCRKWNGFPVGGRTTAKRQIDTVTVTVVARPTPPPGRPARPEEAYTLWKGACPVP
jgi:hypothetical protein